MVLRYPDLHLPSLPAREFEHPMNKIYLLLCLMASFAACAQEPVYGPQLEGFDYPAPVQYFQMVSQSKALQIA